MRYFKKYDPSMTLMYPSGKLADKAQVEKDFPACKVFDFIIETDEAGQIMYSMQNLSAMRTRYGVDASLDARAAVEELARLINEEDAQAKAAAENALPSAEERIAAALEYQNLLAM